MQASKLNQSSPLAARFYGWMAERFPPAHAVLFFVLYLSAVLFGGFLSQSGSVRFGPRELLGFAAAYCFFLMLRVFDEHKDFTEDCENYPDRVLQRGLITLGHLKVAGAVAIAVQFAVSLFFDSGFGPTTIAWLVVIGWSLLMAAEFFAAEWLKKRLLLYAVSHMVVMPMALVWMAQMGSKEWLPASIALLSLLSFFSGFAFELARKTKSPDDERDAVQSYTKVFGTRTAPMVTLAVLAAGAAVLVGTLLFITDGTPNWILICLSIGLLAAPAWALARFRASPSAATAKQQEGMCSLYMLAGYVILIVAVAIERGIEWG